MCGRFVSASPPDELARYFGAVPPESTLESNFNVAPTTEVYAVRADDGHRSLGHLRWGLIPTWAKDPKIGSRMINARGETVASKPAFRSAYQKRRCILPVDGFYEWQKIPGRKTKLPHYITRLDGEPMAFAGLWERWSPRDDEGNWLDDQRIESCTIVTTEANETMAPVHDRMPVMIPPNQWDAWLDPESDPDGLQSLLVPGPVGLLGLHPVSTAVNRVANNDPALIEPVEVQTDLFGNPA